MQVLEPSFSLHPDNIVPIILSLLLLLAVVVVVVLVVVSITGWMESVEEGPQAVQQAG